VSNNITFWSDRKYRKYATHKAIRNASIERQDAATVSPLHIHCHPHCASVCLCQATLYHHSTVETATAMRTSVVLHPIIHTKGKM